MCPHTSPTERERRELLCRNISEFHPVLPHGMVIGILVAIQLWNPLLESSFARAQYEFLFELHVPESQNSRSPSKSPYPIIVKLRVQ